MARFRRRVVTHRYGRWDLNVSLEDPTGETWYDRDWLEPSEFDLLARQRLRPGARVFDLGAHQGVVALMLARAVGLEGSVVAVEADPVNVAVAERNKALNGAANLVIVNAAVGDTSGDVLFDVHGAHMAVTQATVSTMRVPAITIDKLAATFGMPDIVYIDIEGFEAHALRGAARTLASRPDCYIEVHSPADLARFGVSVDDVLAFFPTMDYQVLVAPSNNAEFVPIDQASDVLNERFFLFARPY